MEKKLHWGLVSTYRQEIMGLACLWIILRHNYFDWPTALKPLKNFVQYGVGGVEIFLFLSGISLFYSYRKKPKLLEFYNRRWIRLLIPYLLFACPYWIWRDIILQNGNFLLDITMLSFPLNGTTTTWFIGTILVFYLIYPAVYKFYFDTEKFLGIPMNQNCKAICLSALVAVLALILMYICPAFYDNIEIGLTRTVIFLIGCRAGQWVYEKRPIEPEVILLSGVLLVFYVFAFRTTVKLTDYWIRMSQAPMAVAAVLLLTAILSKLKCKPIKTILVYFGNRSLELYLAHVMLKNVYLNYFPFDLWDKWGILSYAAVILVSLIIGEIFHRISQIICSKILSL